MVAALPATLAMLDLAGTILALSAECERRCEVSAAEGRGRFFWEVFAADRPELARTRLARTAAGEEALFASGWTTRSGKKLRAWWRARRAPDPTGGAHVLVVGAEVVEDFESMRRETVELFAEGFRLSPTPHVTADYPGDVIRDVNEAFTRRFGWAREEAVGRTATELGLWVDLRERDTFLASLEHATDIQAAECLRRGRDGRVAAFRVTAIRTAGRDGARMIYALRDISDEQQAEIAKRESEEKFAKAFRASPDSVTISALGEDRLIDVNEGFTRLHEWTREEAVGRTSEELRLWADPAQGEHIRAELAAGRPVRDWPVARRDRHGVCHQCLYSGELAEIGGRTCVIAIVHDITERQRLEEQFRHAQRMESVGRLAGGVAHDFNNVLTVILGHSSMLLSSEETFSADTRESLREIEQSASFAANLTRQLLLFSRKQVMQRTRVMLDDLVARVSRLLQRVIGEDVLFEVTTSPGLPAIQADPAMVEQVLLNLAVNARDAMPHGGCLALRTQELTVDAAYLERTPQARTGHYAGVSVRDSGEGIQPEILPRIFDPFFTTKPEGKGTGLGLATVYGIMQQHGGWIEVDSRPGEGATFSVWFPAADASAGAAAPAVVASRGGRGTECILIAEDKEPVRLLLRLGLQKQGYHVLAAGDPDEAVVLWNAHRDRIALLITDVVMPGGITGRDLAIRLRVERPGLKAIFCSGYGADIVGPEMLLDPANRFVAKPFEMDQLCTIVREMLDRRGL